MAERTSGRNAAGGNGATPPTRASSRARLNTVRPRPAPEREHGIDEVATRPSRQRVARRAREDAAPADERTRGASGDVQRASTNSIRPTLRRSRAAERSDHDAPQIAGQPQAPQREGVLPQGTSSSQLDQSQRDRRVVPDEVKQRFVQVGNKYHFPDGTRAFTDHGNRLTSPSENSEVIKSLIAIAHARGWSDVTISGTERFRKEAWFAARLTGLDVRGYSPTEFEQERLVRALARTQTPASHLAPPEFPRGDRAEPHADNARAQEPSAPREQQRTLQVGRLVSHGAAPYLHDPHNDVSYLIRVETPNGEREVWGVDLQRALQESLTRPQVGDEIGLWALRQDAVTVSRREYDEEGRVVGKKELGARRNAWIVEKRDFFRERAQAARVLRDPSVDRQAAVKEHPELVGTYLQLHAAELAAKTLGNLEEQRRFVASVRTALADSVARGEPLATVPLKEAPAQPREPRARRAPAAYERDAAPTR